MPVVGTLQSLIVLVTVTCILLWMSLPIELFSSLGMRMYCLVYNLDTKADWVVLEFHSE